jgi:hypothetical protein
VSILFRNFFVSCSSPVFVEGDIETRVYNDNITGQVRHIPEITVRREGTFNSLSLSLCKNGMELKLMHHL